ncbi:MAG: hypothetical protein MUP22_09205 [Desulfobacterales bacterium]|nr:hypothetical protein [Desulfobacterales bacterium]
MAGNKKCLFGIVSRKNFLISLLLSAPIASAICFWFLQPTNFISKRYIAAAILLWIVLAAGIYLLLRPIRRIIASIDQQLVWITILFCLITASILGLFVIGIENTPYNLFTLPKHSLVIENASVHENDVIELIYLQSGLGDESFSKFVINGNWTRLDNSLFAQETQKASLYSEGTQEASLYYEGWLAGKPVLGFQAQPNGGRVDIYWDGELEQVSLFSSKPYQKYVSKTIEPPIFNKLSVLISGILTIAIILFTFNLLLAKIVNKTFIVMPVENPAQTDKIMRRTIASILTIAACILFIGLIILLLSTRENPPLDVISITNIFALSVDDFNPEPNEHLIYVISTLTLPFLCAGFYLLFTRLLARFKGEIKIIHLLLSVNATVCVIALTVAGLLNVKFYMAASSLVQKPYLAVAFCAGILSALVFSAKLKHKQPSVNHLFNFAYFFAGIALIILLAMETTFNEMEPFASLGHFLAYFDSVVQVYLGKTLLVNDNAQYGLYALLLKPIFQLVGLSVFKFTLVMGILKSLAYMSLLIVLRFATKNRWIAFAGFATIAFYTRFRVPLDITMDPYFQYSPHRFFFPAVFVLLVWVYLCEKKKNRKKILYFFISLFCALSVLWNLDSGLVVLATWLICLVYTEMLMLKEHKFLGVFINSVKHCLVVSAMLIFTFIGFYLYTYFFSGAWPDVSGFLAYTKLFSENGFYMLPILQIIHPWNMFVIIYILGVFIGVRNFLEYTQIIAPPNMRGKREKEANTLILVISVLGIGLFFYYVGRSHNATLTGPSWPVFLLLTIFTDRLFSGLSQVLDGRTLRIAAKTYLFSPRIYYRVILFAALFCFLTSSVLSIAIHFPPYLNLISTRQSGRLSIMPDTLHAKIEFIKSNSDQDDQILILSGLAPLLYLYTNTPNPLPVPGFYNNLIFNSDMRIIFNFLEMPPANAKIFWGPTFTKVDPTHFLDNLTRVTSGNDLILYEKK